MIETQIIAGLEVFSCLPPGTKADRAQPLLFIHGAFAGGWMWTETFMPFLAAAGYPCYALSVARPWWQYDGHENINWHSVADYVDDIRTSRYRLARRQSPVLIGHSMGGFVIQKYLERHTVPGVPAVAALCSVPPQGLVAARSST
jgi:pimeloyl-ACP methyl ester carboxylesterase